MYTDMLPSFLGSVCVCHCSGTVGIWYVSGPQHETRTDLPQDVWRVWYLSVLILS